VMDYSQGCNPIESPLKRGCPAWLG
jgi:hypothetical protein